jgi:YHS domain-containing protein
MNPIALVIVLVGQLGPGTATVPPQEAAPPPAAGPTPLLEDQPRPDRVMPADPVILRSGRVAMGEPTIHADWEGTRYRFATEATRATFLGDPVGYAARDGGACGRMGPLGGLGDARLYAIEEGLLYFFASEACMRTFRDAPHSYMEPYDILPAGTPEQQAEGMKAVDRWVRWSGGKDAVRAASRYSHMSTQEVLRGSERWTLTENVQVDGPRQMRRTETWSKVGGTPRDTLTYAVETTPAAATITGGNGLPVTMVASRRQAFERQMNRLPYCILRARFRPEAGFLAIKSGEGKLGEWDCDFVQAWFDGNLTYLAIDKASGRLVQTGHMGRTSTAKVVSLTNDVAAVGPEAVLRLPTRWVSYETDAKEGTMGPELSILIERASPPAQPAAATPPSVPPPK